jgi:hypothetical protein
MASNKRLPTALLSTILAGGALAQETQWQAVTGADTLRGFLSGASAERELPNGGISRGVYNADGSGEVQAWGEVFPRTWRIEGDERFCIDEVQSSNCYRLEQSAQEADLYRSIHVETGAATEFRLIDGETRVAGDDSAGGNDGTATTVSAEEMANKLANPTAAVATLGGNFVYNRFDGDLDGADDESGMTFLFQPVVPFPQENGQNILFRPAIPIILDAPVPDIDGGFSSEGVELGDIGFDLVYGGTNESGTMFSLGVAGLIPTATEDAVGADQWRLGPEILFGIVRPWGAVGAIVNHQWDIGGSNDESTSITGGQYFYAYNLGGGLQFAAGPSFSYNHKAESGQRWSLPLGVGLGKTTFIGGRPWKFQVQYWNFVERPDLFSPEHQIRLTITPVVEVPWGK